MSDKNPNNNKKKKPLMPTPNPRPGMQLWVLAGLLVFLFGVMWVNNLNSPAKINQQKFEQMLAAGDVQRNHHHQRKRGGGDAQASGPAKSRVPAGADAPHAFRRERRPARSSTFRWSMPSCFRKTWTRCRRTCPPPSACRSTLSTRQSPGDYIGTYGFIILMIVGFWFLMRRMGSAGGPGGQIFSIGKSKAALFEGGDKVKITFKDVAGLEEAKEEVQEIVEFLKNPSKFTILGGKIPERCAAGGPSRHRQNPAGQSRSRRGRRAVLLALGLRLRGDVCGRGRGPGARLV